MSHYLPYNWIDDPSDLNKGCNSTYPQTRSQSCPSYLNGCFENDAGLFWPIIVITIVVFLVWAEYGSQDCRGQTCNNKAPVIDPNDSIAESIDKTIYAIRKNHTVVGWRRSMLVAIFVTLLILMWMCRYCMVHGFVFLIVAIIIFFITYFASAWFQSHWFTFNDIRAEQSLRELRSRLKEIEIELDLSKKW